MEQIALMKPKALNENETGFLEYIDDIIGTNMYEVSTILDLYTLFYNNQKTKLF